MCGIFGIIGRDNNFMSDLRVLASHATQRGRDSSGLMTFDKDYSVVRAEYSLSQLIKNVELHNASIALGHSRLITDGAVDNQPVVSGEIVVFHNGIIVNADELFQSENIERHHEIDTEIIPALVRKYDADKNLGNIKDALLSRCVGIVATAIALPKFGKLVLLSNNGSLYYGEKGDVKFYASEEYPLNIIGCENIEKIQDDIKIIDLPFSNHAEIPVEDRRVQRRSLVFGLQKNSKEEKLLENNEPQVRRCTKCILPATMPFIRFDADGVCNYCHNYTIANNPKPVAELFNLVEPYRRPGRDDCIVPFSGGRDSCYGLHLVVNELGMRPITYTYDWGMVTDLGRRNISRMSAKLGVENIIIAADIGLKRENIKKNIQAWLRSPHLGMVNLFTAGDKHFFQHVETVKKQTGIDLNLWGLNPLETTHFKTGFLGIPPYFDERTVYSTGLQKQIKYQSSRFREFLRNPSYFNSSIFDSLSGEFYRSIKKKQDYFHIYDYWKWDEDIIEKTLFDEYDWEMAPDTVTSWRIGDGTAAFYNYIFYTVAGFTEHDTFRSNQIREGQMSRGEALRRVREENKPRYQNMRWYLDTVGLDFSETIKVINEMPKIWRSNQ
jgi:glucosamine--fructose-6-phosphate aminotransferase (isomerizing)